MLDLLRRKAQSPFLQATIVIIAVVFVFWGTTSNWGNKRTSVATVNDREISYQEFQLAYDQVVTQYRDRFGGTLPKGFIESLNLEQQVLNQLIRETLFQQAAQEAGLSVSKEEIRNKIRQMSAFQNNGAFDMTRYQEILTSSRMTVSDFENSLRIDLLSNKLDDHLTQFARVSDQELKDRFIFDNKEINLEYVAVSATDFEDQVTITDEALHAFFEENKNAYKTPPQIKLKYLVFPFADDTVKISDQEIDNYYQQNITQFNLPEKRQARHILVRTSATDSAEIIENKRKQAESILEMVRKNMDFATLAKEYSEDGSAVNGGDLGYFSRGQMVKPFEDAAFALSVGEVSDVIRSEFGFHVIKLEAVQPARIVPLEDARPEIEATLRAQKGKDAVFKEANQAYEDIILSGSLEKYAAGGAATLKETDFFSRQSPPSELAGNRALLESAFSLNKGELSSLIEDRQGYSIIYVADIKEPEIPPLDAVQAQVKKDFVAKQAEVLAREAAEKMLAEAKAGAALQQEAAPLGGSVKESGFFSRITRSTAPLPAAVTETAFKLTERNPYPETIGASGPRFYVYRLKEKKDPAPELFEEKKSELRTQMRQEKQQQILASWYEFLRNQAEIKIDEKFI